MIRSDGHPASDAELRVRYGASLRRGRAGSQPTSGDRVLPPTGAGLYHDDGSPGCPPVRGLPAWAAARRSYGTAGCCGQSAGAWRRRNAGGYRGGKVASLEPVRAAVEREVREELGIGIVARRLPCVVDQIDAGRGDHWIAPFYLVKDAAGGRGSARLRLSSAAAGSPSTRRPGRSPGRGWRSSRRRSRTRPVEPTGPRCPLPLVVRDRRLVIRHPTPAGRPALDGPSAG
jgi:ADP-ribose pyrophosphatase YjhB (NUDIX family)